MTVEKNHETVVRCSSIRELLFISFSVDADRDHELFVIVIKLKPAAITRYGRVTFVFISGN